MECNKDEAIRAKEIAEKKLSDRDFTGAKKFALKAQSLYPKLDGLSQFLEVINVYIAHELKIPDYYGILGVNPSTDEDTLKKQYKKMALSLHPDKNKSVGADGAFKMLSQAWNVLSNKDSRVAYNSMLNIPSPNQSGNASSMSASRATSGSNTQNVSATLRTPATARSQQYNPVSNCSNNVQYTSHHVPCHQQAPSASTVPDPQYNAKLATNDPAPNIQVNQRRWNSTMNIPNDPISQAAGVDSGFNPIPHPKNPAMTGTSKQSRPFRNNKNLVAQTTTIDHIPLRSPSQHQHASATTRPSSTPPLSRPETFWTSCNSCRVQYEYNKVFLNQNLKCPRCKQPFLATEIPAPNLNSQGSRFWSFTRLNQDTFVASSGSSSMPASARGSSQDFSTPLSSSNNLKRMHEVSENMTMDDDAQTQNRNILQEEKVEATSAWNAATSCLNRQKPMKRKRRDDQKDGTSKDRIQGNVEKVEVASAPNDASASLNREKPAKKRQVNDQKVNTSKDRIQGIAKKAEAASIVDVACSGLSSEKAVERRQLDGEKGDNSKDIIKGTTKSKPGGKKSENQKGDAKAKKQSNAKELCQIDIRGMLLKKAKMEIMGKIKEWEAKKTEKKIDTEDPVNVLKNDPYKHPVVQSHLKTQSSGDAFNDPKAKMGPKKSSHLKEIDETNSNPDETISMTVPDANFHNFDYNRVEDSFSDNQVWAAYDDEDGMPRYYALVHHVISKNPFKLEISWLNSKSTSEFGSLDWIGFGFTKTIGDFRVGKATINKRLNSFSHPVMWKKGPRGVIQILPAKGDVWAVYKNWSHDWKAETPMDEIHKYDVVEILECYTEDKGISVAPLVKVVGFTSVFSKISDEKLIWTIPREEMFRFSHQVPFFRLNELEDKNAPKGCYELDPAALPLELLKVITEAEATELAKATVERVSKHNAMLRESESQREDCAKLTIDGETPAAEERGNVEESKHVVTYTRRTKGRKMEQSTDQSQGQTPFDES